VVKATIDALSKMRNAREVAKHRGVDINKVYEG
jgi:small subunit ribosomal protein S5